MRFNAKLGLILIALMLLGLPLLVACDDDETEEPTAPATESTAPVTEPVVEDITVTIGNLTDMTGPASFAMTVVNTALDDIVRHANDENLIPGVELKVEHYDTQYNPANDIPGYEFLKEKGVDLIVAGLPNTPITLQTRVNDDEMVFLAMSADQKSFSPPGYGFSLNSSTGDKTKAILKWVAENDWDYETNGPAEIGIVAWGTSYFTEQEIAAKEYVDAHPEQFEWGGGYFTDISFTFSAEVDATKDFDYLLPPGAAISQFVEQYRQGNGKAKFLMTDAHHPGMGKFTAAGTWDMIDGSYFIVPHRWWGEDATLTNLAEQLLTEHYGEGRLNEYMGDGGAYIGSFHQLYPLIDMIKDTVENVGTENFSTQALYETLQEFSTDYGGAGYEPWGYSETDRFSYDYETVYMADSDNQTLVRVDEEWFLITE